MIAGLSEQDKFLKALLEVTKGVYGMNILAEDLQPLLQWTHNEILGVRNYLLDKNLLTRFPDSHGSFRLSKNGYARAIGEDTMSSSNNLHFNNSIITGLQIQQNSNHSSQMQTLSGADAQSLELLLTKISDIVKASNISEERKQLTELGIGSIKAQMQLPEQQRNKNLIALSWDHIAKLSDLISVVPFLAEAGLVISQLLVR